MIQDHSPGKNWAGNYTYRAEKLHLPSTIEQVQETIGNAPGVRVLGSRHSFNDVADSSELITLEAYLWTWLSTMRQTRSPSTRR